MAVRVRKNGRILCAACYKKLKSDLLYIDDATHYILVAILKILSPVDSDSSEWRFHKRR
jgi:hypothetical protein